MQEVRNIVRELVGEARKDSDRRRDLEQAAKALRFAWALAVDTLYKFKSLEGASRGYTLDIIKNSRLYFTRPDQFNDPFDCAPPFALAKSVSDSAFVKELEEDERRMAVESGLTLEQLEQLRSKEGVPVEKMAVAVRDNTLRQLRDDARVLPVGGAMPPAVVVALCGQPQGDMPTFFLRFRNADRTGSQGGVPRRARTYPYSVAVPERRSTHG